MALKLSETSCIFRQVPLQRMKRHTAPRKVQAANDNFLQAAVFDPTVTHQDPFLALFAPIFALMAMAAGGFYIVSTLLSGYLKSFPRIYP